MLHYCEMDCLRYCVFGTMQMLLALERIENEEDPTYEVIISSYCEASSELCLCWTVFVNCFHLILQQLLSLESNLFLGGLSFHDQHRDMRLDIDNMSYEVCVLDQTVGFITTFKIFFLTSLHN